MAVQLISDSKCYGNSKNYVARITGRDSKMTFAREFIGKEPLVDAPGLYEVCNIDKKGNKDQVYRIVATKADGTLVALRAASDNFDGRDGKEVAMELAKRMDAGEDFGDMIEVGEADEAWQSEHPGKDPTGYRVRSKGDTKKAVAAASIESAIAHCWQALSLMPEKEAKKVLAALKARVSPPKPAAAEETGSDPVQS